MEVSSNILGQSTTELASPAEIEVKRINLALQGGGAHGAFTWGVLDRLMEEERIEIDGISATSAGAMNASVLAYGYTLGGREGARQALAGFWRRVSHAAAASPLQANWFGRLIGHQALENSPAYLWMDLMTRVLSPYQINPANNNPLRELLVQSVDFDVLSRQRPAIKLFLSATNVRTGKIKVFGNAELSVDAVLASSCLPFLFQAVEIGGEHYWDGGYMGNPAIYPLIYNCDSRDVVVVHINPMVRADVPVTAGEIMNRINEISFNSSLMREMRAINFVTRLIDKEEVKPSSMKRMLIHAISAEEHMSRLSVASKMNADWEFLLELKEVGRAHADAWIAAHFDDLGQQGSVDLCKTYF